VRAESEGALWAHQTQSAYQIMHQRERKREVEKCKKILFGAAAAAAAFSAALAESLFSSSARIKVERAASLMRLDLTFFEDPLVSMALSLSLGSFIFHKMALSRSLARSLYSAGC
jgi:Mlc titration factor MtfA (ptsG expression regulator)